MRPNVKIYSIDYKYIPWKATAGASGYDLRACLTKDVFLAPREILKVQTGIKLEIPKGFEAQVRSRSGLAKDGIIVVNSPGTIDSDYRGYVSVLLTNLGRLPFEIKDCGRIAQLVFSEVVYPMWLDHGTITDTPRGDGGFGSTGVH